MSIRTGKGHESTGVMVELHHNRMKQYLEAWLSKHRGNLDEGTRGEYAYHALSHAGFLERYAESTNAVFNALDDSAIRRLILEAGAFSKGIRLFESAVCAINTYDEGDDEDESLYDVLVALAETRDAFNCFVLKANRLYGKKLTEGDEEVLDSMSDAVVNQYKYDRLMDEEYPQLAAGVSRRMKHLLDDYIKLPGSDNCWWYYKHFEFDDIKSPADWKPSTPIATDVHKDLAIYLKYPRFSSERLRFQKTPLAAASNSDVIASVCLCYEANVAALCPSILLPFLSKKRIHESDSHCVGDKHEASIHARLLTPVRRHENTVYAQWEIRGAERLLAGGTPFVLAEHQEGCVVGQGSLNDDATVATLTSGSWDSLQRYGKNPEDFLIVFLLKNREK